MRRLIPLMAAVMIVAGPLAAAGGAMGKEHQNERREQQVQRGQGRADQGRGEQAGRWNGAGRAQPGLPAYRGPQDYRYAEPRQDPRQDPRNDPRYDPRYTPGGDYRADPRTDPRYADPRGYGAAPRRGGFLGSGGQVIEDPGRYRLRAPPRGYDWVRTPGGMALVQQGTGRVYDVVPY
jgi:Ni/Co efflux regulator RcnB